MKIFLLEENERTAGLITTLFELKNHVIKRYSKSEDGMLNLEEAINSDCIICNYSTSESDTTEFISAIREQNAEVPIILLTGQNTTTIPSSITVTYDKNSINLASFMYSLACLLA